MSVKNIHVINILCQNILFWSKIKIELLSRFGQNVWVKNTVSGSKIKFGLKINMSVKNVVFWSKLIFRVKNRNLVKNRQNSKM